MTRDEYLARVHRLPCAICARYVMVQQSPTQAHHPIHDRYSTKKVDDFDVIPLCEGHHQGLMDDTKVAIHRQPALWREIYGPDHGYVERTRGIIMNRVWRQE